MTASIANLIIEGAQVLRSSGVPDYRREAGSLLAHVLGRDRTFIISHSDEEVSEEVLGSFRESVNRRAAGEPLQYITRHQEFFRLDFEVSPEVLIPRPETELLVETALELFENNSPIAIADVGTGSGCIAISLLHERPDWQAVAVDISTNAINIARRNAQKYQVANRISFVVGDCFEGFAAKPVFDVILSNPPYVAEEAISGLQREVREHEPRVALTPGGDGLDVVRKLLKESGPMLKAGGYLLIEIGFDQRSAVEELIDEDVWQLREVHQDLQGIPRTITLRKRN